MIKSIVSGVLLSVVFASTGQAQLAVDRLEMYLTPGKAPVSEFFTVANDGQSPIQVDLSVHDWDRAENGNNRFFQQATQPGSCGKAMSVFPLQLRLLPGQSQQVRVDAAITDTLKSPCWAIVFAQTAAARTPSGGRTISYVLRTGVKLYVHPATATPDGAIDSMAVVPAPIDTTLPPAARASARDRLLLVRFSNTGTKHMQAMGKVEIRNDKGDVAATIQVPEFPTLPGARRILELKIPSLPPGRYTALAVFDFKGQDAVAGQYEFDMR